MSCLSKRGLYTYAQVHLETSTLREHGGGGGGNFGCCTCSNVLVAPFHKMLSLPWYERDTCLFFPTSLKLQGVHPLRYLSNSVMNGTPYLACKF